MALGVKGGVRLPLGQPAGRSIGLDADGHMWGAIRLVHSGGNSSVISKVCQTPLARPEASEPPENVPGLLDKALFSLVYVIQHYLNIQEK
jgi:hypothetical protein